MGNLDNFSIKVKNYKCFGDEEAGFDCFKSMNILIGKNNSGKSSLLDIIKFTTSSRQSINMLGHKGKQPEVLLSDILYEYELKRVFEPNVSGGTIGMNHWSFGKRFIGNKIKWKIQFNPGTQELKEELIEISSKYTYSDEYEYFNRLVQQKQNPFQSLEFIKLNSERNILPEFENDSEQIDFSGSGCTNLYNLYLNNANKPNYLVKKQILAALNKIYEPECKFSEINVKRIGDKYWELFLSEEKKGDISLSLSGSSLKTVLLVLSMVYLIPHTKNKKLKDFIFAFEELENNLHPSLQRKLFLFLKEIALKENAIFFITTHSNIVIDLFCNDNDAQIIHISHDGEKAHTKTVYNYKDNKGIIDDLDIRASDILQSNCIIWVEGPSDRIYLNRWIELFSNGEIKENYHYQCIFYGGRLLAHLSFLDPQDNKDDLVKIFSVNKNSIILIDSDKKNNTDDINDTKKRIVNEIEDSDGIAWITDGNEIENYIPSDAITSYYGLSENIVFSKYSEFSDYLEKIKPKEGDLYLRKKVLFAENISKYLTLDNLKTNSELAEKINMVISSIKKWNGLKE